MIFKSDIRELFNLCDDRYAVMCVKHRQPVTERFKMDGTPQEKYYRKNWSSFMLVNCSHPSNKVLTKEIVNTKSGAWLHGLTWLMDHEIGELPNTYNWIDGSSPSNVVPKVIHYSLGGPWFSDYQDCKFADDWYRMYKSFNDDIPSPAAELAVVNYKDIA